MILPDITDERMAITAILEVFVDRGEGVAILEAIAFCYRRGVAVPRHIGESLIKALGRYESGQALTLGEAFRVPDLKPLERKRKRTYAQAVSMAVKMIREGSTVTAALESASKCCALSVEAVRAEYYRCKMVAPELFPKPSKKTTKKI